MHGVHCPTGDFGLGSGGGPGPNCLVAVGRLLMGGDDHNRGASLYFYPRKNLSKFRNNESAKSHICLEVPSGGFLFSAIALSKGLAPELGTQVSVLIYFKNTYLPNL